MKTFTCQCGNTLFFHSTSCLECGRETGMCPACRQVAPLDGGEDEPVRCGNPQCGAEIVKCYNYTYDQGCNRTLPAEEADEQSLCDYCRLTAVIPDQEVDGNPAKWWRLLRTKQRVLYMLDELGLPFRPSDDAQEPGADVPLLSFEFKADEPDEPVHTGHNNGCITINIREADTVQREQARIAFGEPQRTLVGHFRHELGHYFWDRLVRGQREEAFREVFGDEREPSYADALEAYYEAGPAADWQEQFISAYATMHPWEDFAETFGAYLDMASILLTAGHFHVAKYTPDDIDALIANYQQVGIVANEFNRDMGLLDLVPEVFVRPVIEKLRFVHSLVRTKPAVAAK